MMKDRTMCCREMTYRDIAPRIVRLDSAVTRRVSENIIIFQIFNEITARNGA
jgi:hypothetical protein